MPAAHQRERSARFALRSSVSRSLRPSFYSSCASLCSGRRVPGATRWLVMALPGYVRSAYLSAALLNGVIGVLFLLGPELRLTPWPSPVSPVLTRFIGAIILGNAVGAFLAVRQGTWEGARVLLYVAAVYGLLTLIFVPWAILTAN